MVSVTYKRKKRIQKLAEKNEFQQAEHVVDTTTKNYLPVEPTVMTDKPKVGKFLGADMAEVSGMSLMPKHDPNPAAWEFGNKGTPVDAETAELIDRAVMMSKIPPALATHHEGQEDIRLTDRAHEYNLDAYKRLMDKSEGYKQMTVDHSSMALEIALFILAGRNGPDHAKRMHLLELAGGTWSWINTGREESKAKDGTDKEQDLYLAWLGTTFLVGARATLTWKAGIEFLLTLHRKEHEESKTTKI